MFRALVRIAGYAMLAAAMLVGVYDGARSVSVSGIETTPFGSFGLWMFPRHFPLIEPAIVRHIHPWLWDPLLLNLFLLPAVVVLFALGGLLMALGRPQAPPDIAPGTASAVR